MVRANASILWEYFEKIDKKSAKCKICGDILKYFSTSANLKSHLRRKHQLDFSKDEIQERARLYDSDEGNNGMTYEYVVVSSPPSSVEDSETKTCNESAIRIQHKESRSSFSAKRRKHSHHVDGNDEGKKLLEKLTEDKIRVTNLQKKLIEKEMEEKDLKIFLLQEEIKRKRAVDELEKQEIEYRKEKIEHQKQMDKLEKQEKLLKIEILKNNLGVAKHPMS